MHKETIGEWILEMAMSPDRATSVVGDLEERGLSAMQFWLAIGSNILHAIDREVLLAAGKTCLAQFVFPLPFAMLLGYTFLGLGALFASLPFAMFAWISGLLILGVQILTGFWLTRQGMKRPLLVCLLVVILDCALGLLRVNNASINMAIWSVPLLGSVVAFDRRRRRNSIA